MAGPFDSQVRKRAGARPGNNHPIRYLLLTKHEPHPRDIGRLAECVNTMGTVRLFAFKDWATVRDADPHLHLLGLELDRIARQWSGDRHLIGRLGDLKTMRRAAREVRRLKRALRGAISARDVQVRVQAFEARDQWPPEAVDRLRIGLPGYIPRRPLPWPLRVALLLRYVYNWRRYRRPLRAWKAAVWPISGTGRSLPPLTGLRPISPASPPSSTGSGPALSAACASGSSARRTL